jgi:hypothetical protein
MPGKINRLESSYITKGAMFFEPVTVDAYPNRLAGEDGIWIDFYNRARTRLSLCTRTRADAEAIFEVLQAALYPKGE